MLLAILAFMTAHRLSDVTVVADIGLISAANQKAIEDAGLSFILSASMPEVPYVVTEWRRHHPVQDIDDGAHFHPAPPAGLADRRHDQVIYYQYRADWARRISPEIDEQVVKAQQAIAGKTAANATLRLHTAPHRENQPTPNPSALVAHLRDNA
jgi:hypothetical protein